MALEDIFKALEHQAESDISDVLAEARARAAGIVQEAEAEAERIRRVHAEEAQAAGAARGVHSRNASRLEARRKLASVRQYAVKDAFDRARARLEGVRTSSEYGSLFERLLDEALDGVEGEFEVLVDARDAELALSALKRRPMSGVVRPDLTTAGGVVVSMQGGRVLRRNTLEDRFEKFAGTSQSRIAELLFS